MSILDFMETIPDTVRTKMAGRFRNGQSTFEVGSWLAGMGIMVDARTLLEYQRDVIEADGQMSAAHRRNDMHAQLEKIELALSDVFDYLQRVKIVQEALTDISPGTMVEKAWDAMERVREAKRLVESA